MAVVCCACVVVVWLFLFCKTVCLLIEILFVRFVVCYVWYKEDFSVDFQLMFTAALGGLCGLSTGALAFFHWTLLAKNSTTIDEHSPVCVYVCRIFICCYLSKMKVPYYQLIV